eukprot:c41760_g1_i1 orf=23-217(+)
MLGAKLWYRSTKLLLSSPLVVHVGGGGDNNSSRELHTASLTIKLLAHEKSRASAGLTTLPFTAT